MRRERRQRALCACHGHSSACGGSQAAMASDPDGGCLALGTRGGLTEGLGGGEPDAVRYSGDNSGQLIHI